MLSFCECDIFVPMGNVCNGLEDAVGVVNSGEEIMFDQMVTSLVMGCEYARQREGIIEKAPWLPVEWNMYDRSAFTYCEGSRLLKTALTEALIGRNFVIAVKDTDTSMVAIFDTMEATTDYFNMSSLSNVRSRLNRGYCSTSRTAWVQYRGGDLVFEELPTQKIYDVSFMLIGIDPNGKKHLYQGLYDAAIALKVPNYEVRKVMEGKKDKLENGWLVRVATVDDILIDFPHWTPYDYRHYVGLTSNFDALLAGEMRLGFGRHTKSHHREKPWDAWATFLVKLKIGAH